MDDHVKPQLGRMVVLPFGTIGVIAAVLMWAVEHAPSLLLMGAIAGGSIAAGVLVAWRLRRNIDTIADHYEALLKTADEQSRKADQASRLKDEFLATLSHELRTPLNSVLGWSRLLASGKLDPDQSRKAVQAIERAGWTQSRLIEDLLDVSRIVSGKMNVTLRSTLVQPLVENAVDALHNAAIAKHIAVAVAVDPSIGAVALDPDRIQQVVWNLLSNAIKFTPNGGRVDVVVDRAGDDLCLTVSDTGIGFEPAVAAHLFERFRQGDSSSTRQYGGLGLGLGIVRHIVELHGGTVTATSAGENRGSRFEVRLPMQPATAPVAELPAPRMEPPSLRGVSVLVVDDDPNALDFVRATLEQYGALVITAQSSREATARFKREPTDVVVSDLMMPDGDGCDFIREIRKIDERAGRQTPAAALTALARVEDRRKALKAGYQMHVAKPVDPHELVSTVERLAHAH
ncbi:MAG TPA: ATP-binding protein [Vicinamibacterales bacterium]|nr:ATP-binding protein [Vicinamibacterales bacterium]